MSVNAVTKVQYRIMLLEPNPGPIVHDLNQLGFLLDFALPHALLLLLPFSHRVVYFAQPVFQATFSHTTVEHDVAFQDA